ncbi:MAG: multiprotein bridging factor aMBF1 [Candidatus Bathyarchaeia archaeon]
MRCEICGKVSPNKLLPVSIEGARLLACVECAKLGTLDIKTGGVSSSLSRKNSVATRAPPPIRQSRGLSDIRPDVYAVVDDYGLRVRKAREEHGWSQEELGKMINEKASLIGKIETSKLTPSLLIAKKLEHVLGVSLLVKEDFPVTQTSPPLRYDLTIGDVVTFKKQEK